MQADLISPVSKASTKNLIPLVSFKESRHQYNRFLSVIFYPSYFLPDFSHFNLQFLYSFFELIMAD